MRDTSKYRIDGVRVPSVTEILKLAGLGPDFGMVDPHVLETARRRGELVHNITELIDLGHLDPAGPFDEELEGYVRAYLAFKDNAGFKVDFVEKTFVNERYRYAGMIDRVGRCMKLRRKGRRTVDIKCVAQVGPPTRLQVAGYAEGVDADIWSSLQLFPNGKYKHLEYTSQVDKHDFLACVRVAHFKLAHGLATLETA